MQELQKARPFLQGIVFVATELKGDGLHARGAKIGEQANVREVGKIGKVTVQRMSVLLISCGAGLTHQRRARRVIRTRGW